MWHMDELELRSFLLTTAEGMNAWFRIQEREAETEASARYDPRESHGDEAYSLFMDRVGIFWEQYWYQLSAAVVKDAFTLYEVFLEESAHRVLQRHSSGLTKLSSEDSWRFDECRDFYKNYLHLEIEPLEVSHIHWIRNKLSHLRDSFRTDAGEAEFADRLAALGITGDETDDERGLMLSHHEYGRELAYSDSLTLSPLEAWRILDILRSHVESLTLALHALQYGPYQTEVLASLRRGKPFRARDRKILQIPSGDAD